MGPFIDDERLVSSAQKRLLYSLETCPRTDLTCIDRPGAPADREPLSAGDNTLSL